MWKRSARNKKKKKKRKNNSLSGSTLSLLVCEPSRLVSSRPVSVQLVRVARGDVDEEGEEDEDKGKDREAKVQFVVVVLGRVVVIVVLGGREELEASE